MYATAGANNSGVVKFNAALTSSTPFITVAAADANGLFSPAGMTFDSAGHLWVSNFAIASGSTSMVQEYFFDGDDTDYYGEQHDLSFAGQPTWARDRFRWKHLCGQFRDVRHQYG